MAKIPVRFRRVAAAFDEVARARLCESSGSEHSSQSITDLSDLVNSFIERDGEVQGKEEEAEGNESERESFWCDDEKRENLLGLFGCKESSERRKICEEVEVACRNWDRSSQGFKRKLMIHLRDRGFDAGLCKSRWEKTGRFPAGSYEYVDVNLRGNRYIVEVNLAAQFEIVRPADGYISLLEVFPPIFVGKAEKLKQIVRLMCTAARESIKKADLLVPPWRKNGYMQEKWFSSYKRTTNAIPATKMSKSDKGFAANRSIGFAALPVRPYYCGGDHFASKLGLKVGQLTAAFMGEQQ